MGERLGHMEEFLVERRPGKLESMNSFGGVLFCSNTHWPERKWLNWSRAGVFWGGWTERQQGKKVKEMVRKQLKWKTMVEKEVKPKGANTVGKWEILEPEVTLGLKVWGKGMHELQRWDAVIRKTFGY